MSRSRQYQRILGDIGRGNKKHEVNNPQMNLKHRLIIMQFLQFFISGCWIISFSGYLTAKNGGLVVPASPQQLGAIFATYGVAVPESLRDVRI